MLWGPYLSERAWASVREDYGATGDACGYFPHEHARSRAYRWSEDGLAGFCDVGQTTCLAVALWNGKDPFLKERLFGLSGPSANHGEDVKERYFYLDGVPTHAYMKMRYEYPQVAFPYDALVEANRLRGKSEREVELFHLIGDAIAEGRIFDVVVEYAKAGEDDIVSRITVDNRGPDPHVVHVLPHLWFRNTWSWADGSVAKPSLEAASGSGVLARHPGAPDRRWWVAVEDDGAAPPLLFTENETNRERVFGQRNASRYVKDGIHEAVVAGRPEAVHPSHGTKVAAHVARELGPGESLAVWVRLSSRGYDEPFAGVADVLAARIAEADTFYASIQPADLDADAKRVQRQAYAGLLWTKQVYHYDVGRWLDGEPSLPGPRRWRGRNAEWRHMSAHDVISMPDTWEFPWFAAWDLAFHTVPFATIDPAFAKDQLLLLVSERYMHPNGALPAYEWAFSDTNPPVHAWATWQVYAIEREKTGRGDRRFLERMFHKLLLNFAWWVNKKDRAGHHAFEGGFLGLDNIGPFDRSAALPHGGRLEQSDGTAWMAAYCLDMLEIARELAKENDAYDDIAAKLARHFGHIRRAFYDPRDRAGDVALWDETDGFFYDVLELPDGRVCPLKVRSLVGLMPIIAVSDAEELAVVDRPRLERVLRRVFDEAEFLSRYGLRSMSRAHRAAPYVFREGGTSYVVRYDPAESSTSLFGGNSNWRGPVWFPINFRMVQALRRHHAIHGDDLRVEVPTGSGVKMTLAEAADEIGSRLCSIFLRDPTTGRRPVFGDDPWPQDDVLFFEYFHGETGAGLGASHQTGWTALVALLLGGLGR